MAKSFREGADERATLLQMAKQTGGHAFLNTNALADAVARSIDEGSNYYTLTYSPGNIATDGKFHQILLKPPNEGLTLAYRRGYHADLRKAVPISESAAATPGSTALTVDLMRHSMLFGSPAPTQVSLEVLILPVAGAPESTLANGNQLGSLLAPSPPYRRYDITLTADPSNLAFTVLPGGNRHASLQYRAYVYTADGHLINTLSKLAQVNFLSELYTSALQTGLMLHQQISIPLKEEFYLRIGLHDVIANRDGPLEVPISSVKDLSLRSRSNPMLSYRRLGTRL